MDDPAVTALALKTLAIFARVSIILFFLPIFGEDLTPLRVRVPMAFALTAFLLPVVPGPPPALPATVAGAALALLPEVFLGLTMGLVARLTFAAIQLGGQMAGEQIGFGIGSTIDPTSDAEVTPPAHAFHLFALLIFFLVDGHHLFFGAMVRSFELVEPFTFHFDPRLFELVNGRVAAMYGMAVVIAAPVIVAMLLSSLALGLISRSVPQANVFIESFPIRTALGLFVLALTFGALGSLFAQQFGELERTLAQALQLI